MHLELRIIGTEEEINVFANYLKTLSTTRNNIEVTITDKFYPSPGDTSEVIKLAGLNFEKDSFK